MNDGSHHEFNLINRTYHLCKMREYTIFQEYSQKKKLYEHVPIFIVLIMQ
jgi:hypothetical protein